MRPSRPPDLAARFARQHEACARDPAPPLARRVFSDRKPVFDHARRSGTAPFRTPYGQTFDRLLRVPTRIA
ncbi:hypothetical protein [Burkholderia sp. IMCC1007]|uniref:hypothetical protein n=1 Tax=Burkholderia sp. IMCC1007 TaxID=3004104 RepID=UPI0022B2AECD|nr:hypothetical protein [Burkholderia sp. IMCC1007]